MRAGDNHVQVMRNQDSLVQALEDPSAHPQRISLSKVNLVPGMTPLSLRGHGRYVSATDASGNLTWPRRKAGDNVDSQTKLQGAFSMIKETPCSSPHPLIFSLALG